MNLQSHLIAAALSFLMPLGAGACETERAFFEASDTRTLVDCFQGADAAALLDDRDVDLNTVLHLTVLVHADLEVFEAVRHAAGDDWDDIASRLDREGRTALHLASVTSDGIDTVNWLLSAGSDQNTMIEVEERRNPVRWDFGITPLHEAVKRPERADIVSALLAAGADPEIRRPPRDEGWTAALVASRHAEDIRILTALSAGGADLEATSSAGNGALHIALAWDKPLEVIQYLISMDVDPNKKNDEGLLPLHIAARYASDPDVVRAVFLVTDDPCSLDNREMAPRNLLLTGNEALKENQELERLFHEACVEGG